VSVRTPPRPPYERVRGVCSLCGTDQLEPGRRSWCSQACVDTWLIATQPTAAYRALVARDGETCAADGCDGWQPGDPTYWTHRLYQNYGHPERWRIDPRDYEREAQWARLRGQDHRPVHGPPTPRLVQRFAWPNAHTRLAPEGEGPPPPVRSPLEVEHVRPLWSLTPEERRDLSWWGLPNLQLLCQPCHRAKTRHEAGWRAAVRAGRPWPPEPAEQLGLYDQASA
jgi:hypothetical protein